MLDYKDAMSEFRTMFDGGDAWDSTMNMWFAIAEEMYHNREFDVPESWQFRPSPFGNGNDPNDYATAIVEDMTDDALRHLGAVIHRYAGVLQRAGVDY